MLIVLTVVWWVMLPSLPPSFFGYIINLSLYFSQIVILVVDLNLETSHDKIVSEDTANRCVIKNCLKKNFSE